MAKFVSLIKTGIRKSDCHGVTVSQDAPFGAINVFLTQSPGYYFIEVWNQAKVRYYFTDADVAFEFKLRFA